VLRLLTPAPVRPREIDSASDPYVRSFLIMRVLVGLLAFLLPLVLVLVDWLAFSGDPAPRDSLSAYYYSGVRELFVGALCATAVFLFSYKVSEISLDNTMSWLAGLGALLVALFPTGRPSDDIALTPLQDRLSECAVQVLHFGGAALFIGSLGVITYYFGQREGKQDARPGRPSPAFWRRFHHACTIAIGVAVAWIIVTKLAKWPRTSLLIGEWAAVWAFGISWFAKGAEIDVLRGKEQPADSGVE
jgi:hypothetical protein